MQTALALFANLTASDISDAQFTATQSVELNGQYTEVCAYGRPDCDGMELIAALTKDGEDVLHLLDTTDRAACEAALIETAEEIRADGGY